MNLKIESLNLFLGLSTKKDKVANILRENELRVLYMQEIGIEPTANPNSLSIKDYKLELENNSINYLLTILMLRPFHLCLFSLQ